MPRHSLADSEVRALIAQMIPLLLQEGSVSALQRTLQSTLADDRSEGWIYPNRLHTLLSGDQRKGVNTETFDAVRLAVARLSDQTSRDGEEQLVQEWRAKTRSARGRLSASGVAGSELAERLAADLAIPPGVVHWLLGEDPDSDSVSSLDMRREVPGPALWPDWSFQDRACDATLRALRRGPNRKVGLVLPTGAGKTRVAIRVALRALVEDERDDTRVLWVTHRSRLKTQARRELQRAITEGTPELPEDAVALLSERVHTTMIGDLPARLDEFAGRISLVVVDEAHHAAAPSYAPIFDRMPLRGLFLTATPNRTDELPIGIDEIAFTITYRELFDLGVLIEPTFEPPLTVGRLDWTDEADRRDLADYILGRAEDDFVKTLIVTSRLEHVRTVYDALLAELNSRPDHVLRGQDIGYVHGASSSTGASPEDFLDEFARWPRGIVVATSQLLGEGFDDPSINAVVVTYPTTSMIQLMQAAGRSLRFAPGKKEAYVVQVRDSDLAYHFEQRWLYQDISDVLRPQLIDLTYSTLEDLHEQIERLLTEYRVSPATRARIARQFMDIQAGDQCSLQLSGLPYYGGLSRFNEESKWSAYLVTPVNRDHFLRVFNDFSARGGSVSSVQDFLKNYLPEDTSQGSTWKLLVDMLHAMRHAQLEADGVPYASHDCRPYQPNLGTSWLTYVTFRQHSGIPDELARFLADAVNREAVSAVFSESPGKWSAAVKLPLPLAGTWAYLLEAPQVEWLNEQRQQLLLMLTSAPVIEGFGMIAGWRLSAGPIPVPQLLVERFEVFLNPTSFGAHYCMLAPKHHDR